MAKSIEPFTWKNGYKQPSTGTPWKGDGLNLTESGEESHYEAPGSQELLTSTVHNSLGLNSLRTWPTMYNGTNSPHGIPEWWRPSNEVDVLICGAGPFGLEVALSLVRQGVTFRIIDKADSPLIAGRADGVQPRFLELLHSWGLAQEVHEEGPIIESTVIYKDGKKLFYDRTHQSDSRYRGLHIITQGQLERIYVRDLMRHQMLVERSTSLSDFEVQDSSALYPFQATIKNEKSGTEETVRAKFLIGADGAGSTVRAKLGVPFDGVSTNIYWGILDCIFDTDFPYFKTFGVIVHSELGGCIIIPRENGYVRIYTQLDAERVKVLPQSNRTGRVDGHSITAEEVLEQANRIFAPFTIRFAAPLSWFAVWKISERVARSFSSPDSRIHIGGDAAHVHSVMGAFGLNASIMDASNLAWKIGLCAQGRATLEALCPTYDRERRPFARRIINVSGSYLRFACNSRLPLAELEGAHEDDVDTREELPGLDGTPEGDLKFLGSFFGKHDQFLLGLDAKYGTSVISPQPKDKASAAITVCNGARAPNPRICFDNGTTGYLYDKMTGASTFHIIVFGSDLQGPVRQRLAKFSRALESSSDGFFHRFGGPKMFNVLLVLKTLPFESTRLLQANKGYMEDDDLRGLREHATILYDDRAPDEDAHYWYGVNHARGAVVMVRPDLWIGMSTFPEEVETITNYFDAFLVAIDGRKHMNVVREMENGTKNQVNVRVNEVDGMNELKGMNGVKPGMANGVPITV